MTLKTRRKDPLTLRHKVNDTAVVELGKGKRREKGNLRGMEDPGGGEGRRKGNSRAGGGGMESLEGEGSGRRLKGKFRRSERKILQEGRNQLS